ncbi:uncharacterized protein LOC112052337 isoform X2 [Bicyclus anynana]|uniref:Uncharacterized protein LOC112052337 isoform X3 n=1 Tax=Bicyclus anynana TaxID=110368 RepID=A0A6J1NJN6_BICAN|nr:uncharacterized protein LOC112052337 isoform X2 [Bicyclus anynana]XP_023947140.1 uncharacterized protein LOC112052337 isoform X2 [Bicyclus anynana]
MSDDDQSSESGTTLGAVQVLSQLQIVDMPPAKRSKLSDTILPDGGDTSSDEAFKYVQVLDSDKNVVVDLLNLTLVKCDDGQESYRLVTQEEAESGGEGEETVTCVLSNDDGDEHENNSYVVIDGNEGPVVFLQSSLPQSKTPPEPEKPKEQTALTPVEILERAKSLQKAKALMSLHTTPTRGRRRKTQLPPPHELLASPHFRLYLYSCKLCSFKCNAIKELTAHKAAEHAGGAGKWRAGCRASTIMLQCARCPFRGNTHSQLMKHVKDKHLEVTTVSTSKGLLESPEVSEADVLVCGACGFESSLRHEFKLHIEEEHGVSAC